MTDRRARYRAYISALDPTADPERAVDAGLCVEELSPTGRRIGARLEIEPTSAHLVVGGTGSGKTTELIRVERRLRAAGQIHPARFDVPGHPRVEAVRPGVLLGLAVMALVQILDPVPSQVSDALRALRGFAVGREKDPWEEGHDWGDEPEVWPGVLLAYDKPPG